MPLELSILMQLALRQRGPVTVGDLPPEVANYLGCHPAIAYLGYHGLKKIVITHPEISYLEMQELPFMIAKGRYVSDPKRRQCVTLFGRGAENGKLYLAGLKAANRGGEVWVSTFHRSDTVQEAHWLRCGTTLRNYK